MLGVCGVKSSDIVSSSQRKNKKNDRNNPSFK
jgi:hypothetical protein